MGEQIHVFLTAALCGGKMSVSDFGCFVSRQRRQQPLYRRLTESLRRFGRSGEEKSNLSSSVAQSAA